MPAKKPAAKPVKKGYHRMPDGSLMKGAAHERSEGKREREREYGNGKNGKPSIVIAISVGKPKKSAPKRKGR